MPSLTFVLPHWLYWLGLIAVPLIAMYIIKSNIGKEDRTGKVSLPIAYFMLITAGFIGIHRLYLRNKYGFIYIPLFVAILFANIEVKDSRNEVSNANNNVTSAKFRIERIENKISKGDSGLQSKLEELKNKLETNKTTAIERQQQHEDWNLYVKLIAGLILILLVYDASRLPKLYQHCLKIEDEYKIEVEYVDVPCDVEALVDADPKHQDSKEIYSIRTRFTNAIDKTNEFVGNFVAYWSVIAVIVYYYEVIARYVFNSPTNWAHESMFLMFGMQYLLAGGYVLRNNGHVRVDVFYANFSARNKAAVDVATSVFFFIFAITMAWTGWTFFMDSYSASEVSFTEWAIQYYPIKFSIPLGASLLLLQGFAWLMKDIVLLSEKKES